MTEREAKAQLVSEIRRISPDFGTEMAVIEDLSLLGAVIMLVAVITIDPKVKVILPAVQEAVNELCKEPQDLHSVLLVLKEFIRD